MISSQGQEPVKVYLVAWCATEEGAYDLARELSERGYTLKGADSLTPGRLVYTRPGYAGAVLGARVTGPREIKDEALRDEARKAAKAARVPLLGLIVASGNPGLAWGVGTVGAGEPASDGPLRFLGRAN